ncbi:MAG: GerAB/ArcD/ProY family transporter [Symbiobacteriia bacterium]
MKREQIGTAEATFLMVAILSAKAFLTMPRYMMLDGATAAWLEVILTGLVGALGWAAIVLFMRRFPGRSLIQAVEEILGPYLALPVQLLYVGTFLWVTAVVVRQFAESVLAVIMPVTPISVIITTLLGAAAYACYLGIEAVARAARYFIPIIFTLVVLLMLLVLPAGARLNRLFPLLGPGLGPLLWRAVPRSSLYLELLLLPILAPSLKEPGKMARIGYQSIVWTALLWLMVVLAFELVFPFPAGTSNPFPLLALARLIHIGRFIQRVESFFIFAWIFAAAAKLSASLLAAMLAYAQSFRLRTYRPLAFPFAVLATALALLPPNLVVAMHDDREVLRLYGFIVAFVLTLLLWGVAVLRHKGGAPSGDKKNS